MYDPASRALDDPDRLRNLAGFWLALQAQQAEIKSLRAQLAEREPPPPSPSPRRRWQFWRRG